MFVDLLPVNCGRAFAFRHFDERLVTAVFKSARIRDGLLGFFYGSVPICFILCGSRGTMRDNPFEIHSAKDIRRLVIAMRRRTFSHLVQLLRYV